MKSVASETNFLAFTLILQLIVITTMVLDIPIARQVIGFAYLTFVPGFIIVKLLGLSGIGRLENILLSIGLSVAFLMLIGLFVNELFPLLGFLHPLSTVPLMIVMNAFVLIGSVLVYKKSNKLGHIDIKFSSQSLLALGFAVLPILSVEGAILAGAYGNNLMLLLLLVVISLLFAFVAIFKKELSSWLYPFALLTIAMSLLFHSSFISKYIVSFGSDASPEYFLFQLTEGVGHWSSAAPFAWDVGYGRINAMLSVTILPTVYSNLLNIDPSLLFKTMFTSIFAFVPLCLYQVWQGYIGKKRSFIATFLFMAQATFFTEMLGLNRQMIGELFFALLFLVVLKKELKILSRMLLFMIFSIALVVSHYALAEIFMFFILIILILGLILKRPNRQMVLTMVVFLSVVMFSWYIYTSGSSVFDSFIEFGDRLYRQLGDFFNPASRGRTVLRGLGLESAQTVWNSISRIFAYLTQAFIVAGFVGLITKRVRSAFDREYYTLTFVAVGLLAALILVPGLADTLNMTRFYHILLFFLAPLCVLGAEVIAGLVFKTRARQLMAASILLLAILVPYFLFQTDFIYEVTKSDSWSLPLSMYRMNPYRLYDDLGYIPEQNIIGSQWLSKNIQGPRVIYADMDLRGKALVAYGLFLTENVAIISNTTRVPTIGIVILGRMSVVDNMIEGGYTPWNSNEMSSVFEDVSKVYTNGDCDVYHG